MPTRHIVTSVIAGLILTGALSIKPSAADNISPSLDNEGRTYSTDTADSSYFGSGPGSRLTEASMLRFKGEQYLTDGKIEKALPLISKAVQFDPGDPEGHILYAKALTAKFYQTKGKVDEKLLGQTIQEWRMIWRHDADVSEQADAKWQCRKLMRIAKALNKKKLEDEKTATAIAAKLPAEQQSTSADKPKDVTMEQIEQSQENDSKLNKLKSFGEDILHF